MTIPLINFQNLTKSFGARVLFENLSLSIFKGDRLGLIGPNGVGKSTLLKILAGHESQDSGTISIKKDLKIGYVPQISEFPDISPFEVVLSALKKSHLPDYEKELLAETNLSRLGFSGKEVSASRLSGGWKKRLAIAHELVLSPDILFLDEPTNHLDLEGIVFLEKFLAKEGLTCLIVSHDRYFLEKAVNRIVEIDKAYPEGIFAIDGSYHNFLEKKEIFLEGQLKQEQALAFKARRETDWLRRSPKARTTKSEARIAGANEIIDELSDVKKRNQQKKADIGFIARERETRKLAVGHNLTKKVGEKTLFQGLDFTLSPGTRLGLIGPNGAGKTTFLRLLAGETKEDAGTLKTADDLKIVHFDQHRAALPLNITLKTALAPNSDFVNYHGREVHINGWCKRFLFTPEMLEMPLEKLSGGERARISIAHLMLQEADLLLLDEPTNDLDIQTLEILEESLLDFQGALVLITHDRYMLTRVCNLFLGFGNPDDKTFYADYAQWELHALKSKSEEKPKEKKEVKQGIVQTKLSYQEKKELTQIEQTIVKLEKEVQELSRLLEDSAVTENAKRLDEICKAIGLAETKIEQLYLRWEELET